MKRDYSQQFMRRAFVTSLQKDRSLIRQFVWTWLIISAFFFAGLLIFGGEHEFKTVGKADKSAAMGKTQVATQSIKKK